jgi:hypothetical protein
VRRWRPKLFVVLILIVLAVGGWLFVPTRAPVDAEAAARVYVGMTLAEVEAVLALGFVWFSDLGICP